MVARRNRSLPKDISVSVIDRDGNHCVKCRSTRGLAVHHIIPVIFGGPDVECNLLTLCQLCHDKAPNDPIEFFKYCTIHLPPEVSKSRGVTKFMVMVCLKELGFIDSDVGRNKVVFEKMGSIVDDIFEDLWNVVLSCDDTDGIAKLSHLMERAPKM